MISKSGKDPKVGIVPNALINSVDASLQIAILK